MSEQLITEGDLELAKRGLRALAIRQPDSHALCVEALLALEAGVELPERLGNVVALGLQGLCMYEGSMVWMDATEASNRLGVGGLLRANLESWIKYDAGQS